jgi:uncharacterized membrane-anchored protein
VSKAIWHSILALFAAMALPLAPASAQQQLEGQVLAAGFPIAHATVTLFSASSGAPAQLSRTETATDGQFTLRYSDSHSDSTTYISWQPAANRRPTKESETTLTRCS